MKTLITQTTGAATSESIRITNTLNMSPNNSDLYSEVPCTICVNGTLTTEDIIVQYKAGSDWYDLKTVDSTTVLSADNNVISIFAPVTIRIVKPVTSNSVGVMVNAKRSV